MKNKYLTYCALSLGIFQVFIILLSWLMSAAFPELPIRSLLSSEGIRWYFGKVTFNMSSPILIMTIFALSAYGSLKKSRLLYAFRMKHDFREKTALQFVALEVIFSIIVMVLLTCLPHAILLSVTGDLYPSSFANSLIPVLTFTCWVISSTYALMSGKWHSSSEVFNSLTYGISLGAPIILIMMISIQLVESVFFVLQ